MEHESDIWVRVAVSLCSLWAGVVTLSGCETVRSSEEAGYRVLVEQSSEAPAAGRLGSDDLFELRIHGEADLGGEYRVSESGEINVPMAGSIEVRGLTCDEVEQRVTRRLEGNVMKSPNVSCLIREYNSKQIYIFGNVKEPGAYGYRTDLTMVEAIARAGGMTKRADPNSTKLTRDLGDREVQFEVPVEDIIEGEKPDFKLYPGDVIFVPESLY